MKRGYSGQSLPAVPVALAFALCASLGATPLGAYHLRPHAALEMADESAEADVKAAVHELLDRLGKQRFFAMAPLFTKNAIIVTARKHGGGSETQVETASEWLARMQSNPNPQPFEEVLENEEVTIDGDALAYLRADFKIVRDGREVSSGVDVFTLVKKLEGWKVASIAYTSIPTPIN